MMKTLFLRTTSLLFSALFLTACGGGGGGGGDDTGRGGSGSPSYTQQFNTYMPLAVDTSINYEDGTSGVVAYDEDLSSSSEDIYSITYGELDDALTLLFKSTASSIELHGIRGNFEVSGARITQLLFDEPLVIYDGSNSTYAPTQARASLTYNFVGFRTDVDISYTKTETDTVFSDSFGDGDLPVVQTNLATRIQYDEFVRLVNQQVTIDITLNTELMLAKGIGIVSHVGNYAGQNVNAQIGSLTNLPQPIWFDYNLGSPVALSDTTFTIPGQGAIRSENYKIANQSAINALGWITVEEDTSSSTFNVTLQPHDNLPDDSDLPISVEVVFESLSDGERLSSNVTLVQ